VEPGRSVGSWTLDVSLGNARLYRGCEVRTVCGHLVLMTQRAQAVTIVGANVLRMAEEIPPPERKRLTLAGDGPPWALLTVCHMLHHAFDRMDYDDGGEPVVISRFGW
jgi:hypothetical protein